MWKTTKKNKHLIVEPARNHIIWTQGEHDPSTHVVTFERQNVIEEKDLDRLLFPLVYNPFLSTTPINKFVLDLPDTFLNFRFVIDEQTGKHLYTRITNGDYEKTAKPIKIDISPIESFMLSQVVQRVALCAFFDRLGSKKSAG